MAIKLHIDGVPVEYEPFDEGFYRMGSDINERIARVSYHSVPSDWLSRKEGVVRTGGHLFEFKEIK